LAVFEAIPARRYRAGSADLPEKKGQESFGKVSGPRMAAVIMRESNREGVCHAF
jgi:hypothetical protein